MIRVVLPQHLRTLAGVGREVTLDVADPVTQRSILDALEARYPMLRGTVRDHVTHKRRAMVRFFACEEAYSNESAPAPLTASAPSSQPFPPTAPATPARIPRAARRARRPRRSAARSSRRWPS